ncbi:MAG: hypothetical protein F9K38_09280 [Pseudorhodoplanes sp.]|nr:MAG: hypothetical protein F9K38_09280 [Pseudorhodoplanes sp.]
MIATGVCLIGALALLPRAVDSVRLLAVQDDPAALADRRLAETFDRPGAIREIESALGVDDPELARSFVDLARDRRIDLPPDLVEKVATAAKARSSPASMATRFAQGLIVGEPDDVVSLAGTALGDLFVFGDIRDVIREGGRMAAGQEADHLILGLASVGIAITAGTYATLGVGAPARIGLSVVKAARKTGRLGARMGEAVARSLRGVVDWSAMRKGLAAASITEPAVAVRAVREAVKVEKADDLLRLTRDVGRVQTKAGTRAALDSLKIAESPREMTRVARLAESKGAQTRAILKYLGRGAIALTVAAFDLVLWIFWAALLVLGFVVSMKRAVERSTERHLLRKKARRLAAQERRLASAGERA